MHHYSTELRENITLVEKIPFLFLLISIMKEKDKRIKKIKGLHKRKNQHIFKDVGGER